MSSQNQKDERSTTDQILDLLLDALAERQRARRAEGSVAANPAPRPAPPAKERRPAVAAERQDPEQPNPPVAVPPPRPDPPPAEVRRPEPPRQLVQPRPLPAPPEPRPGEAGWTPPPRLSSINMGKMLGRLALLIGVLIVVVNIPVNRYGVSLARIMPESSSLIIRDGLVLKGSGPEIYVMEQERLRWISSMDAFEHMGLTWEDVRVVEDEFLLKFEKGRPIHVLLKCDGSEHIYRLENEQKRWIKDIDTFLAEGHAWEDVRFVGCQYLRDLPTGPSIPEDAGSAPEP